MNSLPTSSPRTGRRANPTIGGVAFPNPVLLASGTAGFGLEVAGVSDVRRLGGVVTKSISLEPRQGNPAPRVAEFQGGMLNAIGLANPGVAAARELLPRAAETIAPARLIASVVGFAEAEYAEVVRALDDVAGIVTYELNLSCPNADAGGLEFGADAGAIGRVVGDVRRSTERPLWVKLSPAVPDVAALAAAARDAGADAVTVVNTFPGRLVRSSGEARLGFGRGGVSGPAIFPMGLLAVRLVLERTGGPVVAAGGVRSSAEARAYLREGATLLAIGTGALANPRLPERVVDDWERHGG